LGQVNCQFQKTGFPLAEHRCNDDFELQNAYHCEGHGDSICIRGGSLQQTSLTKRVGALLMISPSVSVLERDVNEVADDI
jgi:hypothetical protein